MLSFSSMPDVSDWCSIAGFPLPSVTFLSFLIASVASYPWMSFFDWRWPLCYCKSPAKWGQTFTWCEWVLGGVSSNLNRKNWRVQSPVLRASVACDSSQWSSCRYSLWNCLSQDLSHLVKTFWEVGVFVEQSCLCAPPKPVEMNIYT